MPPLIRLFIRNGLAGFGLSAIFVGLLLALDVMALRALVFQSPDGLLAVFLIWFFNGLLFGAVQIGYAVMTLGHDPN